jgi:hypothetical protein
MLAITDIIVIVLLVILAANGAYQGLLRSLVGPVALLISLLLSVFVYFSTKSFSASFLTAVLGPFFFAWIIVSALKRWLNSEESPRLSIVSRVGGQVVNVVWGSIVIFLTIAFLAFFPFNRFDLPGVSKDIHRSFCYRLIEPMFINKALNYEKPLNPADCEAGLCSASEKDLEALAADPQIQAILNDPRVQRLYNDPAAQIAIKNKDYRAILDNPAIRELSQDPRFLIQALKVYPKIQALTNAQQDQGPSK